MDRAWDIVVGVAVAALTALAAGWMARMRRERRQMRQFLTDWFGEPARPGVEERPGVMVRLQEHADLLQAHTDLLQGLSGRVSAVEAEMQPNHGSSLRDELRRIAVAVGAAGKEE